MLTVKTKQTCAQETGELEEDDTFADFERDDSVIFSFVRHNRYDAVEAGKLSLGRSGRPPARSRWDGSTSRTDVGGVRTSVDPSSVNREGSTPGARKTHSKDPRRLGKSYSRCDTESLGRRSWCKSRRSSLCRTRTATRYCPGPWLSVLL